MVLHLPPPSAPPPVLSKPGYYTIPPIQSQNGDGNNNNSADIDWGNVADFEIGRLGFGSIRFLEPTNISCSDLDSNVRIGRGFVLVQDNESGNACLSAQPAIVTLSGISPPHTVTEELFALQLKERTENWDGARFIGYCASDGGTWRFQVSHFSRYGLDDDDAEIEEDIEEEIEELPPPSPPIEEYSAENAALMPRSKRKHYLNEGPNKKEASSSATEELADTTLSEDRTIAIPDEDNEETDEETRFARSSTSRKFLPQQIGLNATRLHQMKSLFPDVTDESELPSQLDSTIAPSSQSAYRQPLAVRRRKAEAHTPKHPQFTTPGVAYALSKPYTAAATTGAQFRPEGVPRISSPQFRYRSELPPSSVQPSAADLGTSAAAAPNHIKEKRSVETVDAQQKLMLKSKVAGTSGSDPIRHFACSFRVGWSPDGTLICPTVVFQNSASRTSSITLSKVQIQSVESADQKQRTEEESAIRNRLISLARVNLNASIVHSPQNSLVYSPRATLNNKDGQIAHATISQYAAAAAASAASRLTSPDQVVWKLVDALWSRIPEQQGPAALIARRRRLSEWLKEACTASVNREAAIHIAAGDKGYLNLLFTYLSGRNITEAADLAIEHQDFLLTLLLSHLYSSDARQLSADMQQQLKYWREQQRTVGLGNDNNQDLAFWDPKRLNIYKLIAGDMSVGRDLDWRRSFGLHLWYKCPIDTDIKVALKSYVEAFTVSSNQGAPINRPPNPPYLEDSLRTKTRHSAQATANKSKAAASSAEDGMQFKDVCFYLIQLYCGTAPMSTPSQLFLPSNLTPHVLDHSLPWHLFDVLNSLGCLPRGVERLYSQLSMNFAFQLELLGYWWWAIFIVMHIDAENSRSLRRTKAIKDILARNVHTLLNRKSAKFDAIEVRNFLTKSLMLPLEWLHEAMAWYSCSKLDREKQVWHLLHSGETPEQMETAHSITLAHLAPNMLLNGDTDQLALFFGKLHESKSVLRNWDVRGKVYFEYVNVVSKRLDVVLNQAKSAQNIGQDEFLFSLEEMDARLEYLRDGLARWNFETLESDQNARAMECLCIEEMGTHVIRGLLSVKKLLEPHRPSGEPKLTTSALTVGATLDEMKLPPNYRLQLLQHITASHLRGMMTLRQETNMDIGTPTRVEEEDEEVFTIPKKTTVPMAFSQQRPPAQKRPRATLNSDERPDVLDISSDSTATDSTDRSSEDEDFFFEKPDEHSPAEENGFDEIQEDDGFEDDEDDDFEIKERNDEEMDPFEE